MALLLFLALSMLGAVEMKALHKVHKRSVACYEKLGCFSNDGPFFSLQRPLTLVPESPDDILTTFKLFTRDNKKTSQDLDARHLEEFDKKWLNFKTRPTKFIVHGFIDVPDINLWLYDMKNELLVHGDYNVIVVDWSHGNQIPYTQATGNTRVVGAQLALLLKQLISNNGLTAREFHVIGHSLGAHIAGYAGERVPGLGRITALDPAGPYFENTDKVVRLDPTDAEFIDVIHSDAKSIVELGFGLKQQVGHADFYPNLGHDQPGCTRDPVYQISQNGFIEGAKEAIACSHLRAYKYFTESINTLCPFIAFPCDNEQDFASNKCHACSQDGCARMGMHSNLAKPPPGELRKYFLTTGSVEPFCQYHMQVTLKVSKTSVDERGDATVVIKGDKGTSGSIKLNDSPVTFMPGDLYHFHVGAPVDLGNILSVELSWHHLAPVSNPLKWNILGLRRPTIKLDEIDILREEAGVDVHFCTTGQEIETDGTITVSTKC